MPSSYTQSLRLILPVTGELTGTWGDAVNAGLTELVEDAIAGSVAIAMANTNVTLTAANEAADQARNMFLNLSGAHTAQRDVIVPAVSKLYFVYNGTTGGFGVQVKTAGGTGVVVPNGQRMALYCDGTNVLFAFGSSVGRDVLLAADAAAARTTLDVPTRTGGDASGVWPISISGNAATATTAANASALGGVGPSGYQAALGFTPLQQGGGPSQGANNLKIGWGSVGEGLRLTVDSTDFGTTWPISVESSKLSTSLAALGSGAVGTYAILFSASNVAYDSNYAGSSLRAQGMNRSADNVLTTPNGTGNLQTGTWKCLGSFSGAYGGLALFLRIS